jgi:predicted NAD/FAD-dependent oxidoreductase
MAGLAAATELRRAGRSPVIVEKSRGVGGRVATRRIGEATFDFGAQFMTARIPRFSAAVEQWRGSEVVTKWDWSTALHPDAHPRWRGHPTMNALPKHLAREHEIHRQQRVVSLRREPGGWKVVFDGGAEVHAAAVLLTPPIPQSLQLLDTGGTELPEEIRTRLEAIDYDPCIAVMAVLAGSSRIPEPGKVTDCGPAIDWIADNRIKGASNVPALTIHASASFSRKHWEEDRMQVGDTLLEAARPWLGARVTDYQVHGWRYAKPVRVDPSASIVAISSPPLLVAGDACGGPRVEGAALSGWSAAAELMSLLSS